mgnify:CR=1 FL=1
MNPGLFFTAVGGRAFLVHSVNSNILQRFQTSILVGTKDIQDRPKLESISGRVEEADRRILGETSYIQDGRTEAMHPTDQTFQNGRFTYSQEYVKKGRLEGCLPVDSVGRREQEINRIQLANSM